MPGGRLRDVHRAILDVVRRIPRGAVATYGQVALLAGYPGGARVAGAVLRAAGTTPGVPWQRVVGRRGPGTGRIAIHDPIGAALQRRLLEAEGVEVSDAGGIALARYGWLPVDPPPTAPPGRAAPPRRPPRSASTRRASPSRR
jgi:methylated-DNA-protein-cysteine methyltransferase-like protein